MEIPVETDVRISLDRSARPSLVEQIRGGVRAAIADGRLLPGARLPSWRDLAAQLGVARGTVREAYERLVDEQLIVSAGAAGTHVAARPAIVPPPDPAGVPPPPTAFPIAPAGPAVFQLGVPAQDAFPAKAWSRILARAARAAATQPVGYPDPCGEAALRTEIVAYLAVARGIACTPGQIVVTAGYAGALALALRTLGRNGDRCWMEEPGYLVPRRALTLSGIRPVPVAVDAEGLDVAAGIAAAPDAGFALVTPGQQAPLGVTLSLRRRHALLDWAAGAGAWILEDDYLSELQLAGRAAPALASLVRAGRVLHIGTFSKTINPALRLGFLVVPPALAPRVGEVAATLAPAPAPPVQMAVAEFMRDGQYLRHLRHMKRVYARRRQLLAAALADAGTEHAVTGLAVLRPLPAGCDDVGIARAARAAGLAPVPLSPWYTDPDRTRSGLLLGITNLPEDRVAACCAQLSDIIRRAG